VEVVAELHRKPQCPRHVLRRLHRSGKGAGVELVRP
jgi:hypothetical protein